MKVKLDENMPSDLAGLLRQHGHDVATVPEEGLSGSEDGRVAEVATAEERVIVTFDLDFGDIRAFPVGSHAGIVVFRLHDGALGQPGGTGTPSHRVGPFEPLARRSCRRRRVARSCSGGKTEAKVMALTLRPSPTWPSFIRTLKPAVFL